MTEYVVFFLVGILVGGYAVFFYFKDAFTTKAIHAIDGIRLAVEDSSCAARDMNDSFEKLFQAAQQPKEIYGAYFWIGRVKTTKGLKIMVMAKEPEKDLDADGNPWNLVREVLQPMTLPPVPEVK